MPRLEVTSKRMSGRTVEVEYGLDRNGNVYLGDVWFGGEALDPYWLSRSVQEELLTQAESDKEQAFEALADNWRGESTCPARGA